MMMRRNSVATIYGGYSPDEYVYGDDDDDKGWSSERVRLPRSRRHTALALLPFNSGRTLPSKWDDAERWITTSPISSSGFSSSSSVGRPKSKSGPLQGGGVVPVTTTGVFVPGDGLSLHYETQVDATSSSSCATVPHFLTQVSSQEVGGIGKEKGEEEVSCSRRDMGTQMSPEAEDDDVRDVEVDKSTTAARPCKNQMQMDHPTQPRSSWDPSQTQTKLKRREEEEEEEEAKINAWEKLQKAKAEAAIRKLEMKLEKKRCASMDKISNKLRAAEMKAQAMRRRRRRNQTPHKPPPLYLRRISFLSCSCFFGTNTH